jgi:hypothetical protein
MAIVLSVLQLCLTFLIRKVLVPPQVRYVQNSCQDVTPQHQRPVNFAKTIRRDHGETFSVLNAPCSNSSSFSPPPLQPPLSFSTALIHISHVTALRAITALHNFFLHIYYFNTSLLHTYFSTLLSARQCHWHKSRHCVTLRRSAKTKRTKSLFACLVHSRK